MLFLAKKRLNAQAREHRCVCELFDGSGGARAVWQRWRAGGGGVALVYGPGGPDGPNGQDGGAIVYPVGLRCRCGVWLGGQIYCGVKPAKKFSGETRRVSRRTHEPICGGLSRGQPVCLPRRSPERGEDGTGRATHPTATRLFFAKLFFHLEKKSGAAGLQRRPAKKLFC